MKQINPSELLGAAREPSLPCDIEVDTGRLSVLSWLRCLPGKRYVAEAIWHPTSGAPQKILAKLYLGSRSEKSMLAERSGSESLFAAGLSTPHIVASGCAHHFSWLFLDWLDSAKTLAEVLGLEADSCDRLESCPDEVFNIMNILRGMHDAGYLQLDLHLDNFIYSDQCWHIIDTADIQACNDKGSREKNVGVFLSQLPHSWWKPAIEAYPALAEKEIFMHAREHRLWRAKDLARKSIRDCTLFRYKKTFHRWTSVWRDRHQDVMPLLDNIESAMAGGKMLKDGGSSTVVLVEWQGQPLVIKRYNIKNFGHFLRRCFRPSRASHSWQQGHLWRVLELPTAKPIGVIEKRWCGLRLGGYIVTEYTPGIDLTGALTETPTALSQKLETLLIRMANYKISHGDFKGTNILYCKEKLSFIDLDAALAHVKASSWSVAYIKDLARLQRNWNQSALSYQAVKKMLKGVESLSLGRGCE